MCSYPPRLASTWSWLALATPMRYGRRHCIKGANGAPVCGMSLRPDRWGPAKDGPPSDTSDHYACNVQVGPHGATHTGYCNAAGVPDGWGHLENVDGSRYTGAFSGGEMEGFGVFTAPNGDVTYGTFGRGGAGGHRTKVFADKGGVASRVVAIEGDVDGSGAFHDPAAVTLLSSGVQVRQPIENNKRRRGVGRVDLPSGAYYEGMVGDHGRLEGGVLHFSNGDVVHGSWDKRQRMVNASRVDFPNGFSLHEPVINGRRNPRASITYHGEPVAKTLAESERNMMEALTLRQ